MELKQGRFDDLVDFDGLIETSIAVIRAFEPPDGYILAFSGGKDSIVTYDLATVAGIRFRAQYYRTGIDPPEAVKFIRDCYPDVEFIPPIMTMWQGIYIHGLPLRTRRWCCQVLKEHSGSGERILAGIRHAESRNRAGRPFFYKYDGKRAKQKYIRDKEFVIPIARWNDRDVWEYIRRRGLPYPSLYDQGFTRIGCVLCPFATGKKLQREIDRYPKFVEMYRRAALRYYARRQADLKQYWQSGDEYFTWWLSRK